MRPKTQRLWFVSVSVVLLSAAALLAASALRENIVFFYTPSEIALKKPAIGQRIRLGGLVEQGSLKTDRDRIDFIITDGTATLPVTYSGTLPSLFREGQGAVAEGSMAEDGHFAATRILAKHDENYMPRAVAEKLKQSGHWHGRP